MKKTVIFILLLIGIVSVVTHSEIIYMEREGEAGIWMSMKDFDEYNKAVLYELPYTEKSLKLCEDDLKHEKIWKTLTFIEGGVIITETILLLISFIK